MLFLKAFSWETDLGVTLGDFTVKKLKIFEGKSVFNWKSITFKRNLLCCRWGGRTCFGDIWIFTRNTDIFALNVETYFHYASRKTPCYFTLNGCAENRGKCKSATISLHHYKLLDDIFHRNLLTRETLFRPCIGKLYSASSLQPSCDLVNWPVSKESLNFRYSIFSWHVWPFISFKNTTFPWV